MSPIAKAILAGCGFIAAASAAAQPVAAPAAQTPASVPAPAPVKPAAPIEVTPAEEGLTAKAQALATMDAELAVAVKKLQLGTTSVQQQEVDRKLGAVRTGISSVPELVGVSGAGSHLTAEFLVNGGIVRVASNEWITPEWRIAALTAGQVTLERAGGKGRQVINFGHRPVTAAELARDMEQLGRTNEAPSGGLIPPGRQ